MKRKKKKKVNNQCSKQEQRANFNHYSRQILQYLKLIGCEEVAGLFDKVSYILMYDLRISVLPKIQIGKGVTISSISKKQLNTEFEFFLSEIKIQINNDLSLSVKEVLRYLTVIHAYMKFKEKESCDINKMRLIQIYNDTLPDFEEIYQKALNEITGIARFLSFSMSRMNAGIYWLKKVKNADGVDSKAIVLELNEFIPRKTTMIIDDNPRPVYPISLALSFDGPKDIAIPAWRLRLPKESKQLAGKPNIPVYFQNHLLHRLEERIDCLPLYMSQFWLYVSMENPKFTYFKGQRLVEYRVEGNVKLGYVVLEFHKDRFLAKTFLLLTNFGTPEGDKLKEISGMEKCEFQYWAIDKLSTFHYSDLKDHPKTRALFEQAGCRDLFKDISLYEMDGATTSGIQAKQMLRYLEGAKEQEEMLVAV